MAATRPQHRFDVHIPFYHRIAHGLYLTDGRLYWAVLRRSGRSVALRDLLDEPVGERPVQDALQALVHRVDPEPRAVSTHLPPSQVRCFSAQHRGDQPRRQWLEETVRSHLPAEVSLEDFVVRSRPLEGSGGGARPGQPTKYLLALARKDAIEARRRLCQDAGLAPLALGDLRTDLCFAFALDPSFGEGTSPAVLVHDGASWLLTHRDGGLGQVPGQVGAAGGEGLENAVFQLAGEDPGEAPGRLPVAGRGAREALIQADGSLPLGVAPQAGVPSLGDAPPIGDHQSPGEDQPLGEDPSSLNPSSREKEKADPVSPDATPALACAMKAFYVDNDTINFLEREEVWDTRDRQDRREAVQAGLVLGGALAALLLLATGLELFFSRQTARAGEQLEQIDQRLEQVKSARRTRDLLRSQLRQSKSLVTGRTRAALILEQVGQAVPQGIWLSAMSITRAEDDSVFVRASGFATRQAEVAAFLSRLEERPRLRRVRLAYSRILPAETVEQRTGRYRQSLNRFEVRLQREP